MTPDDPAAPAAHVHDVVGVGFGPANLGLAVALAEGAGPGERGVDTLFLESRPTFAWHPGLLLPDTPVRSSFLRDLVTPRTPRSRFTFINYLHEHGRLVEFINRRTVAPDRGEVADYLAWVAGLVPARVAYGSVVRGVEVLDGTPARFRVTVDAGAEPGRRGEPRRGTPRPTDPRAGEPQSGEPRAVDLRRGRAGTGGRVHRYLARSVVLACGSAPVLPAWAEDPALGGTMRVVHASDLVPRMAWLTRRGMVGPGFRALVVGGGQSAVETVRHLHDRGVHVTAVTAGYGYARADTGPFAHRVADAAGADAVAAAPADVRADLLARARAGLTGGVDPALLTDLHDREYRQRWSGRRRLEVLRASEVTRVGSTPAGLVEADVTDRMTGAVTTVTVDVVVCATGLRPRPVGDVLLAGVEWTVGRDHRVAADGVPVPGLFAQGAAEDPSGPGSTLLSTVATRAGEVAGALRDDLRAAAG
ncbi:SidA/IucD/PvdA family monooxygenase [Corynebacterium bovis]|uniref:L-lysine N6-monooxygenase MbtG n=8 Tax=Corynebacterium bovis TaxID=36808 RepID=A0A426Q2K2_9CORY|nr:SidA/IucD/PvdA family monooxygenase [Corynebacterium bovis]RRO99979.1 ornithine monooxygenase [Corynebacterium bovis]RRQ02322.1 ornithine monooxygenase [Corynebacterium bovis]RRQ06401.1 ornithine monooxygenase [Corynebacterium bovis]RRQ09301.1 ornithine monooxygenase [Corynebacterium bovis]